MKNRIALFIVTFVLAFQFNGSLAFAGDALIKKSMVEAFDQAVIIPYHYQGKAFINGAKRDVYGDHHIVKHNSRIMVPIRLMSYLASEIEDDRSEWQAIWQAQKPKEVLLKNEKLHKTIQFTVNNKTMLVNNKSIKMDVAPQMVNGQIVLPLRSASEALGAHIDWLDGLIVISHEPIDLQHPETKAIKGRILAELEDSRKPISYPNKSIDLLSKFGKKLYFVRTAYGEREHTYTLFERMEGESKEKQVQLPGKPILSYAKVVGDQLIFISLEKDQGTIYAYDLAKNLISKIAPIGQWDKQEGWLSDVRYLDQAWYVTLHYGDLTMGYESIYKVENGALRELASGKNFVTFEKYGEYLYAEDFHFMTGSTRNIAKIDMKTGQSTAIGQPDYTYGVYREVTDQGTSMNYSQSSLYVMDDYLYTIGYKESDPKDKGGVYKINLKDQSQTKLTSATNQFWLIDDKIYYIDAASGTFKMLDTTKGVVKTIIDQKVLNVRLHQGSFYYTVNGKAIAYNAGVLYEYQIASGQNKKRSEHAVSAYYLGKSATYYTLDGYEPGLYRINPDGSSTRLVVGNIRQVIVTEDGVAYMLTYKEGIYSVK
ncbi:stalk domain-containing protein [Paenibacillus sp. GCM10027629]|uniref:stalk domain-containing protein n=1 Tax=Paenibacillus sp. GCM10027629 TaxID=3273414 RepID=UPI0036D386A8